MKSVTGAQMWQWNIICMLESSCLLNFLKNLIGNYLLAELYLKTVEDGRESGHVGL